MTKRYYLYILECSNGAYYSGYTTDMERRYAEHQSGSIKCKYTRSFPPVKIAATWEFEESLSYVLRCEHQLKKLSREVKRLLIENPALFHHYIHKDKP